MKVDLKVTIEGNIVEKEDFKIGIYDVYSLDNSDNYSTDTLIYIVDPKSGKVVTVLNMVSEGGAEGSSYAELVLSSKQPPLK